MYKLFFFFYSIWRWAGLCRARSLRHLFGQDATPVRSIQKATASDRFTLIPPGCCTFQFHLWLLHLPDPSLSPKVVSPARSTLIPQGCVPCQIHPYSSRLLPLARSTFLPKSCWSCQIHLYPLRLSPARLSFILQGCCPCQIYLYS